MHLQRIRRAANGEVVYLHGSKASLFACSPRRHARDSARVQQRTHVCSIVNAGALEAPRRWCFNA
jgi:hypothetical protein